MTLNLTLACGDYDLTRALIDGEATPKGIDLTVLDYESPERHWRMGKHVDFDICEMSMGYYTLSRSMPEEYPFTAIPVFLHRRFRHSYMFKHSGADIDDPGDLAGKSVGLRTWPASAHIWMRGIAREEYGLDIGDVTWYVDDTSPVPYDLPDNVEVRSIPEGTDIEQMLIEGELEGAFYPAILDSVTDPELPVERIFDSSQAVEQEYYERTDIFPIMHTVVIRDEILESDPWVAVNMYHAFRESRDICLDKLQDPRWTALAWARQYFEHQQEVLGANPWPFGLTDGNRKALNKFLEYADTQNLTPRRYEPEELFTENTIDEEIEGKAYVSGGKGT